jgi:hypothetical protein
MTDLPINNAMFLQPRNTPESAWLGHIPFAAWLIEAQQPDILVELGTHRGASYLAFCQAVLESGAPTRCYAVDTWQGDEHAGEYGDEIFLPLLDYHQRHYADFSRLMRMRFEEAVDYFHDGSVDVLHIDGLHTYEAVKSDFETWERKLSRRAVVLFHDINVRERGFGVWQYWSEIQSRFPSFSFTHTHGLGVLLVGEEQPDALRDLCAATARPEGQVLVNRMFDQLGRLISANVDIGTLAREQGRLAGLLHQREIAEAGACLRADGLSEELQAAKAALAEANAALQEQRERNSALAASVGNAAIADELRDFAARAETRESAHAAQAEVREAAHAAQSLQLQQALVASSEALARAHVDLEKMRTSMSWRLTGPFRRIRRKFD